MTKRPRTPDVRRELERTRERIKSETTAKAAVMDRMEFGLSQLCDNMAQIAEYPMVTDEVERLHKICNVMQKLHHSIRQFCLDHDELLRGVNKPPAIVVTARNPRKIRREGDTR